MAIHHPITQSGSRNGISLIEVLIAMFVLAVGILSVFGLFAAGREMEARTILLQKAKAFADGPGLAQVNGWMSVGQWLHYDNGWRWVYSNATSGTATTKLRLPLMIDPVALAMENPTTPTTGNLSLAWNWDRVCEADPFVLASGTLAYSLKRVTLATMAPVVAPSDETAGTPQPQLRQNVFENAGDPDDVRFSLDKDNPDNPPKNAFSLGRRARNSDFVPALFLANTSTSARGAIQPVAVRRWILIHHKPFTGYEESLTPSQWPAGSLRFNVQTTATITEHSVITLQLPPAYYPTDTTVIRKSLQPRRWLLFLHQPPSLNGVYEAEWSQISNVTASPSMPEWMVLLDNQDRMNGWISSRTFCLSFESIVDVKELLPAVELTIP
jgi:hypothetical protein